MSDSVQTDDPASGIAGSLPQLTPNSDMEQVSAPRGGKEGDAAVFAQEAKIVAEIKTTAEALDRQALETLQKDLAEAKHGKPEPVIPPDLEDAGVINPTAEAEKVVSEGPSLELPISEKAYNAGLKTKVSGSSKDNEIIGVRSVVALALWVKRVVLLAHKHAKRVIFRK